MKIVPSTRNKQLIKEKLKSYNGRIEYGIPRATNKRQIKAAKDKQTQRKTEGIGNANIMAIMEAGSPIKNIPPRDVFKACNKKHSKQINNYMTQIVSDIVAGNTERADALMEELALRLESWYKAFFVDPENGWAPNAPSTIAAKGSDKPLIDTGELRKSIRAIFIKE